MFRVTFRFSITRLKPSHRAQSELTPTYLAMYVSGLVATFQNPRDFHDHDLVEVLENYLTQYAPYQRLDSFVLAGYVIALCNTGVQMEHGYAEMLLKGQRPDGSYPLGVGMWNVTKICDLLVYNVYILCELFNGI